jgi:hypothetical protein
MAVAHWGAIDGRNEWKDFDTVVLFGLPWRPPECADLTVIAYDKAEQMSRETIERSKLASDIIQAINRIQVRKSSSTEGDCEPSDVFIVLPKKSTLGKYIIDEITTRMPGIQVCDDWKLEASKDKPTAQTKVAEAILHYLSNCGPGDRPSPSDIAEALRVDLKPIKQFIRTIKDTSSGLFQTLKDLGWAYSVERLGRTQVAAFRKSSS